MNPKQLDRASRKFTEILRHKIIEYNLNIDKNGYVKLDDVLGLNFKEFDNITIDDVKNIVDTNEKKRLELLTKDNVVYIRATQGHSNDIGKMIDDNLALEKINIDTPITHIYHGTQTKYVDSIMKSGLSKMSRKHIHFVETIDRKKQVSGFKMCSDAILYVDIKECISNGIVFYKSSNNVILTEGLNGVIPAKYIKKASNC